MATSKPTEGNDPRATGPVRGGGPTLTLRATRGSITVRKPGGQITSTVCSLQFAVCSQFANGSELQSSFGDRSNLPTANCNCSELQTPVTSTAPLLETSFPDLKLHGRGKVRDIYQVGDDLLLDRDRSHLRVRLRARIGHPRQGQGAHAALGLLVRAHGRPRAAPRHRHRRRGLPGRAAAARRDAARPVDAVPPHPAAADRVRRARLPVGLRAGRNTSRPAASAA